MYENQKRNLIFVFIKYMSTSIINAVLAVISTAVLTRIFSQELFGIINLFNSASTVLMGIVCLGLDSAYIRFFYEPPNKDNNQSLAQKCIFLPICVIVILSIIVCVFFNSSFSIHFLGVNSFMVTIFLFLNVLAQIILRFLNINYRMNGKTGQYIIQSIVTQFFLKIFIIVVAFVSTSIESIIMYNSLGLLFLAIIYLLIQYKIVFGNRIKISYKGYREIFMYAFSSCPIFIVIYLNNYLSQFIIKHELGKGQLGVYSAASLFVTAVAVLKNGFGTFWSPFMFKNYKIYQPVIKMVHNYVIIMSGIIFSGILIFSDFFYLLLGKEFRQNQEILGFLLLNPIFMLIMETTAYGISIAKKNIITLMSYIISMIVNVIGSYLGVKIIGLLGASVASAFSGLLLFIINTYFGQKYYCSIENYKKTFFFVTLLIILAASFYVFYYTEKIFIFIAFSFLFFCIMLYKKEILLFCKKIKE